MNKEIRKEADKIVEAFNRLTSQVPIIGISDTAEDITGRGPFYEISAEDYATLEPIFNAETTETVKADIAEFEFTGRLFPVRHIAAGEKHYITMPSDNTAELTHYLYRLFEVIETLDEMA